MGEGDMPECLYNLEIWWVLEDPLQLGTYSGEVNKRKSTHNYRC